MDSITQAFSQAAQLIASGNPDLIQIVLLSMQVTVTAVAVSCLIGFPIGAWIAVSRFKGRGLLILLVNTAMGLPPVVVGLTLYLLLSRSGPLGVLNLLYTPTAMIIAQTVLVTPIIIALTRSAIEGLQHEHGETLRAMHASRWQTIETLLIEARPALLTAALAGTGRALAEVGAVMIVGGNINHLTRVMTTSIALETSRGELSLALALGIVLLLMALCLNAAVGLLAKSRTDTGHLYAH